MIDLGQFKIRQSGYALLWLLVTTGVASAQQQATIAGTVSDPLGGRVVSASVILLRDGQQSGQATTDEAGEFTIPNVAEGRYQIRAEAAGFQTRTTDPIFVAGAGRTSIDVVMPVGPLQQAVVVTAAATALPASRTRAPVNAMHRAISHA